MTHFRQLVLALAAVSAPAAAQSFENLDVLEARVAAALGAPVGVPGGPSVPLDRRMKLAACPVPAIVEAPTLGAATVRCEPLGWRIRVPLVQAARTAAVAASQAEPVIRKGDQVELRAAGDAFSVSMVAIAEEDGAPGARIRVRPERNAPVVIAEVDGAGRVFLPGFK